MLKVFKASPELASAILGGEPEEGQVAALQQLIDGIVTHVTTTMGYANNMVVNQLTQQMSPAMELVYEQKAEKFTDAVTELYPSLKDHKNLVRQVADNLKSQGYKTKDGQEAGRVVAEQVEKILQAGNPGFSLQQGGQPPKAPQQSGAMPQMASIPSGGAAGGAPSGSGNKPKKAAWNVFDD